MDQQKAKWKGTVQSRSEVNLLLEESGDSVLIYRGHPRLLVMLCPCGCEEKIVLNIDPNAGPAWKMYLVKGNENNFTIYPSVWRDTGCGSHFIVWKGKILNMGYDLKVDIEQELLEKVFTTLKKQFQHYEEISTIINENPWSVLWACQKLTRQGLAMLKGKDSFAILQ